MKLSFADITQNRIKFNSHKTHNPDCDILELKISKDAFITYCINIHTKEESMEYYSGKNYVSNSLVRSNSKYYLTNNIPKKYRNVWNGLKYYYETKIIKVK
jgi:hypothetical protein